MFFRALENAILAISMIKTKLKHTYAAVSTFVKKHKALSIIVAFVVVTGIGFGVTALLFPPEPAPAPVVRTPKPQPKPQQKFYSPLNGIEVSSEEATTRPVTAIMLENSPDARPQSGIKDAEVVYEAIAEGGITRFMALYQQNEPSVVGPVRSLRTYFVDWLAPYNPSIAHVGGSKAALDEVRNGSYRDIDQFFNGATYWRATDRYAPHNVYTSFDRINALNKKRDYTSSEFTGFTHADGKPHPEPNATKINVKVSSPTYNSSYVYDAKSNTYARSQGGEKHVDREDGQIAPSVVIGMNVTMQRVMEDGYREKITTVGTGTATLFQNGTAKEITWQKENRASQIVFTDESGKEVALNRGQVWITAVPNNGGDITWQ